MKKRKTKGIRIVELGTSELAPLMNKSARRISMMCNEGKLPALQESPGGAWRILMPEERYNLLMEIQQRRVSKKKS